MNKRNEVSTKRRENHKLFERMVLYHQWEKTFSQQFEKVGLLLVQ